MAQQPGLYFQDRLFGSFKQCAKSHGVGHFSDGSLPAHLGIFPMRADFTVQPHIPDRLWFG